MALINLWMTVALATLLAFVASPALGSSVLELGARDDSKADSVVSLGKAPEKSKKAMDLGSLRFTKGELPAGRLTLKQRMRKRLQLARSHNETLSRSNRERLRQVRSGSNAPRSRPGDEDDIAAFREGRSGGEETERDDGNEDEIFRDIEDESAFRDEGGAEELGDPSPGLGLDNDDDDIPAQNDGDADDTRRSEAPLGDAGVRGGTTSAGKTIEVKEEARDPNGDLALGAES
ncbi:MAG: hypothetical protein AAF903_01005 [Pseudomonadota bacterium]